MSQPNIVGPEYVSKLLGKEISTIRCDARRKPWTLPPRLLLPGSSKLMWVEEDILDWVNLYRPKLTENNKPGRPKATLIKSQPGP